MNEQLMERAYALARQHYTAATRAVFSGLDSEFSGAGFDTVHNAAERGMELYLSAVGLARKVWARQFPFEKAQEVLRKQFSDFPHGTCERAFDDAYRGTR